MRPSRPESPAPASAADDLVTIEAATAEAAIAEVHERLGSSAEIVGAEKVLRGGLWGFFPKQMVQLSARPAGTGADRPTPRSARPDAGTSTGPTLDERAGDITSVLARLSAEADHAEEGLGTALRRQLGVTIAEDDAPAAPPEEPATVAAPHATAVPAAIGTASWVRGLPADPSGPPAPTGLAAALATITRPEPDADPEPGAAPVVTPGPDTVSMDDVEFSGPAGSPWSGRGLLMLGLPRGLVDAVLAQQPADDAAWTYAVARVLTPMCRPLPTGPAAIIGPRAERLARTLGVPMVRLSSAPRGTSSFAVACTDSGRARRWLQDHRGARWTHLVLGGADWRGLLFEGPLAVSWVGDDVLGEAIRAAHDLGMVLGPGVRSDGAGTLVEPVPIELAMLLRDMLGGRR